MFKKNYSKLLALTILALLCMSEKTYGMNTFKQKFQQCKQGLNWKKAAALGFAGGCTVAQYGLAYGGYSQLVPIRDWLTDMDVIEKEWETWPDADPLLESFVKNHVKQCDISQQEPLKVKQWILDDWGGVKGRNNNWIFVPYTQKDVLNNVLKAQSSNDNARRLIQSKNGRSVEIASSDYLKHVAAIIHHECGHIINRDTQKRKFAASAIPIIVAALSFGIRKKLMPTNRYWFKNFNKIISGVAIGPISAAAFYQYNQYGELKADDTIKDNIYLLEAKRQEMVDSLFLNEDEYNKMTWYEKILYTHPQPEVRIKRLKKRIKALKKKGDPKAFRDPFEVKEQEIKS